MKLSVDLLIKFSLVSHLWNNSETASTIWNLLMRKSLKYWVGGIAKVCFDSTFSAGTAVIIEFFDENIVTIGDQEQL